MYVLRDIKVKHEDLTAQIDYVIITPVYTYYVECKNLVGNITVTDKGDFIREFTINGKKIKKGMYSPLRQVEAQREVVRKIWEKSTSNMIKLFAANKDLRILYNKKVICIGPATASAFKEKGIIADFVPETYVAESIVPYFENKKDVKK